MNEHLADFARQYLRRKLAAGGITPPESDLDRLVRVAREPLPGEKEGAAPKPAPPTDEDAQTLVRFSVMFRRGDFSVELNANTGETMAWMCTALVEGNTPLTPEEALRVAEAAATPPANAVLVHHGYEEMGDRPVFVAHWEHREDGILVERDYIRVLVSGHSGRVFAIQRRWHEVDLNSTER